MDEFCLVEKTASNTKALATSVIGRDGKTYPVTWTNQYGQASVFAATNGHSDDLRASIYFRATAGEGEAQVSRSAVSRVSKPAGRGQLSAFGTSDAWLACKPAMQFSRDEKFRGVAR